MDFQAVMNWLVRGQEVARLRGLRQGDVGKRHVSGPYESGNEVHVSLCLVLLPTRQHPSQRETKQYGGQDDLSHRCKPAFLLGYSSVCTMGS